MMKVKQYRPRTRGRGSVIAPAATRLLSVPVSDDDGKLDHVGFTATIANKDRAALTAKLEALVAPPGFTGKAPGGQSRWSTERSEQWQPLKPRLVVEVSYDQVTGNRFRHGAKLLRFRPDKRPSQCTLEQIEPAAKPAKFIAGMLKS
jgi:ATP-dependent DNA ligase